MMRRAFDLAWRQVYARYLLASIVALAADMGCFLALLRFDVAAVPASLIGYSFGLLVHWLVSSRLVFVEASQTSGTARHKQKLLFVGSALVGLAITGAIVGLGHHLGFDPRLAKLAAIGVSFQATYLLRRSVVFA